MLPFFPEEVNNVTVKIGQNAVLKCKVENLNSYKVFKHKPFLAPILLYTLYCRWILCFRATKYNTLHL